MIKKKKKQLLLTDDEINELYNLVSSSKFISNDLKIKIKNIYEKPQSVKYIIKKDFILKTAYLVHILNENNPLKCSIKTEKVSQVKDYSKTLYEIIDNKRYIIRVKKKFIFKHRYEAKLYGFYYQKKLIEKHLMNLKKDTSQYKLYIKKLDKIKRNIYLIEEFPEKFI